MIGPRREFDHRRHIAGAADFLTFALKVRFRFINPPEQAAIRNDLAVLAKFGAQTQALRARRLFFYGLHGFAQSGCEFRGI